MSMRALLSGERSPCKGDDHGTGGLHVASEEVLEVSDRHAIRILVYIPQERRDVRTI